MRGRVHGNRGIPYPWPQPKYKFCAISLCCVGKMAASEITRQLISQTHQAATKALCPPHPDFTDELLK